MATGKRGWFYGWYFKCQSDTQTISVIPAVHETGRNRTCSLQIITEEQSWTVSFLGEAFLKNRFGKRGMRLSVCAPGLKVQGKLAFGDLLPLRYDIMGPFSLIPFLECHHSIWSMKHKVWGNLSVNGKTFSFDGAQGYWEGDRGRSFPREYIWTQCSFPEGALMLSVADIPMGGFHFRGLIGVVLLDGREYRFATYLGAKISEMGNGRVKVKQGRMELEAELLERNGRPLKAPAQGDMVRTIHESAACKARYRFQKDNRTFLAFETDRASFEYEYGI